MMRVGMNGLQRLDQGLSLPRACPNCGQSVSSTARFCSNCGFQLGTTSASGSTLRVQGNLWASTIEGLLIATNTNITSELAHNIL
jgi:predicted amidophosphoribosyltransferase